MAATATKTLEAYLLPPTRWKKQALEEQVVVYREAFQHTHATHPTTKSDVNDLVIDYDLAWQAKDALKNHLPDLDDTDDPAWEQPVRYTSRAAMFDRDPVRTYEVAWRVPMPGRGTSFWIPLQLNPEQRELWHRVVHQPTRPSQADADEVDAGLDVGQVRLQRDGSQWVLHVTVDVEVAERADPDDEAVTPVGFDVGISQLLVGCALENGKPEAPFIYSGGTVRHARQTQDAATERLQQRGSTWLYRVVDAEYQRRIDDEIEQATADAIEYVLQWETPVIVLERLAGICEDIDSQRIHQWAFSRLQTRLEEKAAMHGIPVRYVHPHHTSKICHACSRVGYRPRQAEFRCPYDDCWVSEYHADINAAAMVAQRLDPWGESLPWKPAGDDVPRRGAPVTVPQDIAESEGHPSNPSQSKGPSRGRRAPDDKTTSSTPTSGGAGTGSSTSSADAS